MSRHYLGVDHRDRSLDFEEEEEIHRTADRSTLTTDSEYAQNAFGAEVVFTSQIAVVSILMKVQKDSCARQEGRVLHRHHWHHG